MAAPKAREITADEKRELLSLTRKDITMSLLQDYFACFHGEDHARFNTYDYFTLPAGAILPGVPKEAIQTTVGRYIINMYVLPDAYLKKYGYCNDVLGKNGIDMIEGRLNDMVVSDELSTREYAGYLDKGEWIGMGTAYFLVPTMDYDINVPIPEVRKLRDELFEKHREGIKQGDSNVVAEVEKEVLDLAKRKIKEKGNESFDFFESGVGKFENNYKKTSIMAGAIEDPYSHKLSVLKSNYIDGIDKKEFPKFGALTLIGGYSRGVETQKSGYETKEINAATQTVMLDEPGSDCGTKFFQEIEIPVELKDMFLYRYILDPSGAGHDEKGLVLITPENISKYAGKKVKMRSPLYCKGTRICSKCAGELFYKMGVKNAGLLTSTLSGVLMNASMKKFHDSTVKFDRIDINKGIRLEK